MQNCLSACIGSRESNTCMENGNLFHYIKTS
jgi:hypothetical protein